jgi:hypothetical protein
MPLILEKSLVRGSNNEKSLSQVGFTDLFLDTKVCVTTDLHININTITS